MAIPNFHDRGLMQETVAAMTAEAIVDSIRAGGLSALAEQIATDELARRFFVDEPDYGPASRSRTLRVLDHAIGMFLGVGYLAWLAWSLGAVLGLLT